MFFVQVRLCAISGDIFPAEDSRHRANLGLKDQTIQEAFLARSLLPMLSLVMPPEQAVRQALAGNEDSEDILLDVCRHDLPQRGQTQLLFEPDLSFIL